MIPRRLFSLQKPLDQRLFSAVSVSSLRRFLFSYSRAGIVPQRQWGDFNSEIYLPFTLKSLSELLSRCCETKTLQPGFQCHAQIIKSGLSGDLILWNRLVNLYSKSRAFGYARNLLDQIPEPDLVAWSALISGYVHNGLGREALLAFRELRSYGVMCNEFTFPSVLKACSIREDLTCGRQIHGIVISSGLAEDVFVANALVVMYTKCGQLVDSRSLFDTIPQRNAVSWSGLFAAFVRGGFLQEALDLFYEMLSSGLEPNEVVLSIMLTVSTELGDVSLGRIIHGYLIKFGYEAEQFSANALIDMYAKAGDLGEALSIFECLSHPDIVSWNASIAGCVLHEEHDLALDLFYMMTNSDVFPNFFTFSSIIKACAAVGHQKLGRQLHSTLLKMDMKEDLFVGVGLINMYFKCNSVEDAKMIFSFLPEKDLIVWNAMISGLSQNGKDEEALDIFVDMFREGLGFNQTTLSSVLKSLSSLQDDCVSQQVHAISVRSGLASDDYVINSLVDCYGKCNRIDDAHKAFQECHTGNLATFTSMITAYSQVGQGEEALKLFLSMKEVGLWPDPFVCSAVLNACASLSAYEQGKQVHVHVVKIGYTSDLFAGNSLMNMYAKCGSIEDAALSFSKIQRRGIVSWSAMIGGLAQHGYGKEALGLFDQMLEDGISPNQVTLVSVLCACNHAGLVNQARKYFYSMENLFGIKPTEEHYACMIDLLGRAGKLEEAVHLVDSMPFEANAAVWGALLGASRIHKNVDLGRRAAEMLLMLEPEKSGAHILLANIYASAGKWENVSEMRRMMKDSKVKKEPGVSWIEMKDNVYTFLVGDRSHPRSDEIYAKLAELGDRMNKAGYVPIVETDLHDVDRSEKEVLLSHHSEKLAVAFALIATPQGGPIRVKKNLRICIDCHTAFKFICKIESREIIVRDNNRYHHFRDGSCSCGDYW